MGMGMGKRRKQERQADLWLASQRMVSAPGHAFYERLEGVLRAHGFDRLVEHLCRRFYRGPRGRPSLAPGVYFRLLLIGYFEGLDSERGIAWRVADSLSLRHFLGYGLDEPTPEHSTISRTRRLLWLSTHRAVFRLVLEWLAQDGLLIGRTVSVDATTLEANAAMRSIVRRDSGHKYEQYVKELARAAGIEDATPEQLARFDRKRKKKTSNRDWRHPHDPDARVAKMKDGHTHLAHKAEHAVDLENCSMAGCQAPMVLSATVTTCVMPIDVNSVVISVPENMSESLVEKLPRPHHGSATPAISHAVVRARNPGALHEAEEPACAPPPHDSCTDVTACGPACRESHHSRRWTGCGCSSCQDRIPRFRCPRPGCTFPWHRG